MSNEFKKVGDEIAKKSPEEIVSERNESEQSIFNRTRKKNYSPGGYNETFGDQSKINSNETLSKLNDIANNSQSKPQEKLCPFFQKPCGDYCAFFKSTGANNSKFSCIIFAALPSISYDIKLVAKKLCPEEFNNKKKN